MKIDGETGGQLAITTIVVVVVIAVVFRWKWLRHLVTGISPTAAL